MPRPTPDSPGEPEVRLRAAEAEAEAIARISQAMRDQGESAQFIITTRYIESLKEMARANNAKVVFMPVETAERIAEFGQLVPVPTRLLYGGITEELLLRWGLMTLLVWAAWRLFQRREGEPKPAYVVGAILISSLVFGLGHLPIAYMILPDANAALTLYVIAANLVFGLIAGHLYWNRGLESAVLAHMLAHVLLLTASRLGAYY